MPEVRLICTYCGAEKYPNQEDCNPGCQRKEMLKEATKCLKGASDQDLLDELISRAEENGVRLQKSRK